MPHKKPTKTVTDKEMDQAINAVMDVITAHMMAGSTVSRARTVEFYEGIASNCQEWANTVRGEMSSDEDE